MLLAELSHSMHHAAAGSRECIRCGRDTMEGDPAGVAERGRAPTDTDYAVVAHGVGRPGSKLDGAEK